MPERLVDVKTGEKVLHTFPVTISNRAIGPPRRAKMALRPRRIRAIPAESAGGRG